MSKQPCIQVKVLVSFCSVPSSHDAQSTASLLSSPSSPSQIQSSSAAGSIDQHSPFLPFALSFRLQTWGLFRSITMKELLGHVHRGGGWSGNGFWVPHRFALASLEPGASWNSQCSLVSWCWLGSSPSPSEMALERHWQQAQRSPLSHTTSILPLGLPFVFLAKETLLCLGAASISLTEQQPMHT